MKLLNLLIAIQLVFLNGIYTSGSIAYANDCGEGMYMHPQLNRCVLSDEVIETKNQARTCEGLSGEEYQECFKENAENNMSDASGESTDDVNKGNFGRYGAPIIVTLMSAYFLAKNKWSKNSDYKQCKSGSIWLMLGAGVTALVTEISAQVRFKKKSEELQENFKKMMEENEKNQSEDQYEDATNAQEIALEYMIEIEEARKQVAKTRKTGYMIAGLAYSAAAALAIYEQTQVGSMDFGACIPKDKTSLYTPINKNTIDINKIVAQAPEAKSFFGDYSYLNTITEIEFNEIILRKISNLIIPSAHAKDSDSGFNMGSIMQYIPMVLPFLMKGSKNKNNNNSSNNSQSNGNTGNTDTNGTDNTYAAQDQNSIVTRGDLNKQGNLIDRALRTPYIRAILSGTLATYAFILRKKAKENEELSERRIAALEKVLLEFQETGGAGLASYCEDEDRNNPAKANCYCYNKDGTQNSARQGRDVCIAYLADKGLEKGEYKKLSGSGYRPTRACVKSNGDLDDGCKFCNRNPDSCNLVSANLLSGFTVGSTKLFGKAMGTLNDFNDGSLNASNLDEAAIQRQANAFNNASKKLKKDLDKKTRKKMDKLDKQMKDYYNKSYNNLSPNQISSIMGSASGSASGIPSEVASKLSDESKDKLKKSGGIEFQSGNEVESTASSESSSGDDYDFGFGDSGAGQGGVEIEDDVANVMNKKFDYNNSDIHKNKAGNIFKILSIRYQRSALIRLFDDKGKFKVDEANNSDINSN